MEEARNMTVDEVIALVEYIAKSLVDEPDAVKVELKANDVQEQAEGVDAESVEASDAESDDNVITLALTVAKDDTGKVIGKQGRIAKAIRTVVRAATVKGDVRYRIDIM